MLEPAVMKTFNKKVISDASASGKQQMVEQQEQEEPDIKK